LDLEIDFIQMLDLIQNIAFQLNSIQNYLIEMNKWHEISAQIYYTSNEAKNFKMFGKMWTKK